MPMSNRGDSDKRQRDTWTSLDAPNAAVAAITRLEAIGNSAAESAAREISLFFSKDDIMDYRRCIDGFLGAG